MRNKKNESNRLNDEDSDFLDKLSGDFPDFKFRMGRKFAFRPPRTIVLGPPEPSWKLLALHEVSHAILGHSSFRLDVERLKMESAAWDKAKELAGVYEITVDEGEIQDELDTYRDWLHKKTRCPRCGLTRFQTPDSQYHCPLCDENENKKQ